MLFTSVINKKKITYLPIHSEKFDSYYRKPTYFHGWPKHYSPFSKKKISDQFLETVAREFIDICFLVSFRNCKQNSL